MKRSIKLLPVATCSVLFAVLLFILAASPGLAQAGGGYELGWSIFGGAYGTTSGDGYELQGGSVSFLPGIITGGDYTLTMFPGGAPASSVLIGDVNGDGHIDVADAILILRHIVGLSTLTGIGLVAADVNIDGQVDVADAILILRYIVGLVPSLP